MTKPRIRKTGDTWLCSGRDAAIPGRTPDGAFINWVRYVAFRIVCGQGAGK
ncbi:hypothetical protein [Crenobacter cavernae]|uniref:hypothetical protein n=1 Tax=Crenobacter cavernae TaxID=2290923 RepID=UPI0014191BAF|nr:hypothetical protein [Crenobacter cavernae]